MENEKQIYIVVSLVAICFTFLYKIVFSLIKKKITPIARTSAIKIMDIKISILNEFNKEVSTYITDLDSYELLKKHNIPIQDKIDEMIHKVYFNQVSENNQTEDLVKIPNGDNFFTSEQQLDIPSHLRWHNSKPKQETLEEASKRFYTTEDTKRDCNFINGAKWQQEQDKNKYSELAKLRNELYEQLPTGKSNAFDLIKIINNHINRIDELI